MEAWLSLGRRGKPGEEGCWRNILPRELGGLLCQAAQRWLGMTPLLPCAMLDSPTPDVVAATYWGTLAAPSRADLSCRRGASERESGSYGGQAAEGTCCTHGSSQHFSQGIKTCLTGPCVETCGLLGITQQS